MFQGKLVYDGLEEPILRQDSFLDRKHLREDGEKDTLMPANHRQTSKKGGMSIERDIMEMQVGEARERG